MSDFDRRRFLKATSLALAGTYANHAFGRAAEQAPKFAEHPSFKPRALFLTWQRDPTSTMTIQWVGDNESDGQQRPIWFARKGTGDWQQQGYTTRRFPKTEHWIFRTELTGLKPDADYVFRVGSDSAEHRFRTMPAKDTNTLHFVSGGDSGIGKHPRTTNRLAAAQAPQFVILGGDLAYENGRKPEVFFEFLENYSRDLRDDQQRLIPMLVCIGNHEVDGSYGQPREKAPFYYSFFDGLFSDTGFATLDFGQYMSLVFLDTNHTTPIGGEQTDWLERTLKDRQDRPNLFVVNHVPAYPSHREFDATGEQNRIHWCPLFEKYNVDVVFEHHDHTYKRTHPLLDGRMNAKGVPYLGDGSWGKIRKPTDLDSRPYMARCEESYHLSVHRIEGPQQFHVALADTGRVVDMCVTTKRAGTRRG